MAIAVAQAVSAVALVTTAEAIVASTAANATVIAGPAQPNVKVSGTVKLTPGASTTAIVVKVYSGTAISAANLIDTLTYPVTAVASSITFSTVDLGVFGTQAGGSRYSVSLTQTGAAANSSAVTGTLTVEV